MDSLDYLPSLDVACFLETFDSNFKYDFDSLGCSPIKSI